MIANPTANGIGFQIPLLSGFEENKETTSSLHGQFHGGQDIQNTTNGLDENQAVCLCFLECEFMVVGINAYFVAVREYAG